MARLLLFLLLSLLPGAAVLYAQNTDTIRVPKALDNRQPDFMQRIQAFADKSSRESIRDVEADKAAMAQYRILEQIKRNMQQAKGYLRSGLDTSGMSASLRLIQRDLAIAGDGVFTHTGTAQTFRNLSVTSKILNALFEQLNKQKLGLETYNHTLNTFRFRLDSLSADPMLFKFSQDSATALQYLKQLVLVAREVSPIDKSLKQASNKVLLLLNDLNGTVAILQNNIDEVAIYQQRLAADATKREFNDIWQPLSFSRPFKDILHYSLQKDALTLAFFVQENTGQLCLIILLTLTSYTYLRSLKKIYQARQLIQPGFKGQLVLRHPLLSAIFIVLNLFQFIFVSPPFLWSLLLWLVSACCLSLLFYTYISRYWMRVWLCMVFFFLLAAADNLVLQASRTERWGMLLIATTGCICGCIVYFTGNKKILREKWIAYAILLMAVMELAAAIANVLGRYNLAKSLLTAGFLNVLIAILFLWTIRLINEGLLLAFNVYRKQERRLFFLNLQKVGNRAPAYFYVFLLIGWSILVGRNFPSFDNLAIPVRDFFARERNLGEYNFSINSILLFLVIIASSVLASKFVSFFTSDPYLNPAVSKKAGGKQGLGSWLLLIRIVILGLGLFLALAAAGIPVDRLTIVLGALGVGIGFGLQALVNNLVSGLIIAFEKPVNVGDRVDVDGQSGTMKSIGFRSSIIATWEGADVVIPNGDLLNAHLSNWSLAGNKQRSVLSIAIAYQSDLNRVKTLLAGLLSAEERIAPNPAFFIQYEQFSNSTIELKIYFWTRNIAAASATKSDLIIAIKDCFDREGISIPMPQQEVYLKEHREPPSA